VEAEEVERGELAGEHPVVGLEDDEGKTVDWILRMVQFKSATYNLANACVLQQMQQVIGEMFCR